MAEFNFDAGNFGLGLGAGVLSTLAVQRLWRLFQEAGEDNDRALVRTFATRTADRGYLRALVKLAQESHMLGRDVRLGEVLVEPRFLRAPELASLPDEDELLSVFDAIPQIHDYPFLHASYNIPTMSIDDLSRGDGTLALIGIPGSGRTTALLSIALWSSGYLEFETPNDAVKEQLQEQEQDLDPRELADRVSKRIALAERARNRYIDETKGKEEETREDAGLKNTGQGDQDVSRFRQIAPLYVHLSNVRPATGEYGRRIDPAEPFVRGLQQTPGWLTSRRMVNRTYKLLEEGTALVLLDGFDDLPHKDRPAMMEWLTSFIDAYGDNFIIVSMPPTGYGALMDAGATPVFLRPFDDQNITDSLTKFRNVWQELKQGSITFDKEEYENEDAFFTELVLTGRCLTPQDGLLRQWSWFKGDTEENESLQVQRYLEYLLPAAPGMMPELQRLAMLQLDNGYIRLKTLVDLLIEGDETEYATNWTDFSVVDADDEDIESSEELAEEIFEIVEEEPEPEESLDDDMMSEFYGHITDQPDIEAGDAIIIPEEELAEDSLTEEEEKDPQRRRISREQARVLRNLVKAGVLKQYRGGRYQFSYTILAGYLGALSIKHALPATVVQKYQNPDWSTAMRFLAAHRDIDFLVAEQLSQHIDVLHENVLELTNWLRYTGTGVKWRGDLLRYLGNLMVAPHQFSLVRERVAAALLSSRDEGVAVIFRRALQSKTSEIRKLGALGVGVLRDKLTVEALTSIVLQDAEVNTQLCAAMALGAIGTEDALFAMIDLMQMSNSNDIRRAIAETLAANREEGYLTLYDAINAEDMLMRRAAVFGLSRVKTDWALLQLNETFLEDDEFYVRIAAQVVFKNIYEEGLRGVNAYPSLTEAPWLKDWGSEEIEVGNLPFDIEADELFQTAFKEARNDLIRALATQTIGQVGEYSMIDDIYEALRDDNAIIRDTAYRTLGEFQQKLGKRIPAPVPAIAM